MILQIFQKIFSSAWVKAFTQHVAQNAGAYAFAGIVFASTITKIACDRAHKKLEAKHREEDAERYKAEFDRKLKELEEKYKNNESQLKKKINDLCDEFGIEHLF